MPTPDDVNALVAIVETWSTKKTAGRAFQSSDLQSFVETMNYHTKQLVAITGIQDPKVWESFAELCTQAATLTTKGAKLFGDGKDMTNV